MRRLIPSLFLSILVFNAIAPLALAQVDAQQAFQEARTYYQAGKWAEARDLAQKASQTDPNNPEVFLLLGQSYYQLGLLDEAMTAWKTTLKLAPEEPFAAKMLEALQGRDTEIDVRIEFAEVLIREKLYTSALAECKSLLGEKVLSDAQRAKVMTLQADLAVRGGKYEGAENVLRMLQALYPQQADPVQTTLLLGQAKLRTGGESTAEGLTLLKKVVAEHAGTPAAATARLELINFELKQGVDSARTGALAKWVADSPDHPMVADALSALMEAYLSVTRQGPKPTPEADLAQSDQDALALAAELYKRNGRADVAKLRTGQLLSHLHEHYAANGAFRAAEAGAELIEAMSLPRTSRQLVLRALARYRRQIALVEIAEQVRARRVTTTVPDGPLPEVLAEVVAVFETTNKEFPAEPAWKDQVDLACMLHEQASPLPWPVVFGGLRAPDAWAVTIALPVAAADAEVANQAVELILVIAGEVPRTDGPSRELAVSICTRVLELISPDHPAWHRALTVYYSLETDRADFVFQENIKAGRPEENAKLSEPQKALLATLEKQLAGQAAYAPVAMVQLAELAKPLIEHGHWAVAEEAYRTIAKALPEAERRWADLAVVDLWLQQVARRNERLMAAGLTVPRALDPLHAEALERCYTLQGEVGDNAEELQKIRGVWDQIVGQYIKLEYYEIAEQAVEVKPAEAVEAADEYAALQLARLRDEQARRDLDLLLKQYGASEKIALGPAFEEAIAAYTKFIAGRPTSPLVAGAVERVFAIAELFASKGASQVAAGVYRDFAAFASGVKVLSASPPGTSSTAERAAFAVTQALDAEAQKLLARQIGERTGQEPPPAELSAEYAAAITAYKEFIAAHPESPLVGQAIGKIMAVALEYAKIDAWEVADSIYADLIGSELDIRRPQRLEFCRGLCWLGRAMPDHAREMLSTLTAGGLRESREVGGETMLAGIPGFGRSSGPVSGMGGMGGGGGMGAMSVGGGTMGTTPGDLSDKPGKFTAPAGAAEAVSSGPADTPPAAEPQPVAKPPARTPQGDRDSQLLAMIRTQEANRAAQVAQLREGYRYHAVPQTQDQEAAEGQQAVQTRQAPSMPVLSEAELARQEQALTSAYGVFQGIRKNYPDTATAEQARGEILVMVGHWRTLGQWQRAAALAKQFLSDNPTDGAKPKLSLEMARDWLAWASQPIERQPSKHEMLAEVLRRFTRAREELEGIVSEFAKERSYRQEAQWDVANSYLTQARVVDAFSPTLARGQYVRAAKELQKVAATHADHPQIGQIPQMLWGIAQELEGRGYRDEAIRVCSDLTIYYPMNALAQQAALKIAQTYRQLGRPLKAAEAYQELNFARGGNDQTLQDAIFQIGSELKGQKRWVEALHILETFVDSFPRHPQAGQALTAVGQIHQANEAWEDAIAAYRRVIDEFENGQWGKDARWSIAECTINLSRWREAREAYRGFVEAYPDDAEKVAEANRRIEVLKDLARYQVLVDEEGQRKAFDAQFQIATIVREQLSNPVKAIIEYRKVVSGWPEKHLADDALHEVGVAYLSLGETEKAREALLQVAAKYPTSPLADDALLLVGKSYQDEAQTLATVSRAESLERNKDVAQRYAYEQVLAGRRKQQEFRGQRVADLKKAGQKEVAEVEEASMAANYAQFNDANIRLFAQKAEQDVETLTATQLADRQDKINAALRKAVEAYAEAAKIAGADKADEALLQMATIYDQRLKDSQAAMQTWLEIAAKFSGTAVAEDASWRIAQTYEREADYAKAIQAYQTFLDAYRSSPNAGQAQFAIAENYEHLGEWVSAMDSYTNYINNFPEGPLKEKAKDQINWIKTYRL